ncbi:hypothetical protein [Paenibacillus ferrarius]|uniref:hypothetical protein n=1 Tax=Paenibacillus ferrarius TaxID=1469647 RepID=UPI003D29A786
MAEYAFLLLLITLYVVFYGRDLHKTERKALVWSLVIASPSFYLMILFLYHPVWLGPGDILERMYGSPADAIIQLFTSFNGS